MIICNLTKPLNEVSLFSFFFSLLDVQFQANVQYAVLISSLFFKHSFKSVLLNWDNHIKIESVIGFPEAQNKEETEQTRPGKAPVEPRQLCKTKTCSCKHSRVTSRTPPVCWEQPALHSKALMISVPWEAWKPAFNKQGQMWSLSDACNMWQGFPVQYF